MGLKVIVGHHGNICYYMNRCMSRDHSDNLKRKKKVQNMFQLSVISTMNHTLYNISF